MSRKGEMDQVSYVSSGRISYVNLLCLHILLHLSFLHYYSFHSACCSAHLVYFHQPGWETALCPRCRICMILDGLCSSTQAQTQADVNRGLLFPRKRIRLGSGIKTVLKFLKAKEKLHWEHIWKRLFYSAMSGIL